MKVNHPKEIIVRLGSGSILDGFITVTVELKCGATQWEDRSKLSPNPELYQFLQEWQLLYPAAIRLLAEGTNLSSLQPVFDPITISNVSSQDMAELNHNFKQSINDWFNSADFARIGRRLRKDLDISDRLSVIIVSDQLEVWQLPWHFWDLFSDYPHAVEVFAKPSFSTVRPVKSQYHGAVNILAIAGRDPHVQIDFSFLKTLPRCQRHVAATATSAAQIAEQLQQVQPDILVFYGHGDTVQSDSWRQDGVIYLDNDTPLEISRLRSEIQKAINQGLQIAIFNCCNGLGLAAQIADLNIPYIIVMREIIPNQTAQEFLESLLTAYSQGHSFPAAFNDARQQLKLAAGGFAQFADWLPILFHNPLSASVTWRDLAATAWSRLIPRPMAIASHYLGQPPRRIWTNVVLSLLVAMLALSCQARSPVTAWENMIVDRTQAIQTAKVPPTSARVTIVNYDDALTMGHLLPDDRVLHQLITETETQAKPLAWAINFEFDQNPTIFDQRIIPGCPEPKTHKFNLGNYQQLNQCDRQLIATVIKKAGANQPVPPDFRLNYNLLTGRHQLIDRVNLSAIESKPAAEIKRLFERKLVVVGYFDGKEVNAVARQAIAIQQIITAQAPQYFLPLWSLRSIGERFLWIFAWSTITSVLLWRRHWQLLFLVMIGAQILLGGILLVWGQGVPLITTLLATLLVGIVIRSIKHIGDQLS